MKFLVVILFIFGLCLLVEAQHSKSRKSKAQLNYNSSLPSLSEWVQDIFDVCDKDGDYSIYIGEFIKVPCKEITDKKGLNFRIGLSMQEIFDAIDIDGDDFLTQMEFISAHKITKMLAPYFGKRVTCGRG